MWYIAHCILNYYNIPNDTYTHVLSEKKIRAVEKLNILFVPWSLKV